MPEILRWSARGVQRTIATRRLSSTVSLVVQTCRSSAPRDQTGPAYPRPAPDQKAMAKAEAIRVVAAKEAMQAGVLVPAVAVAARMATAVRMAAATKAVEVLTAVAVRMAAAKTEAVGRMAAAAMAAKVEIEAAETIDADTDGRG